MQIEYRRDLNHNYMLPEGPAIRGDEYPLRMITENEMQHFLKAGILKLNGEKRLQYLIDSCQPMSLLFEKRGMNAADMLRLVEGLSGALAEAGRYLLSPADMVLLPDCIYMDPDGYHPRFCYLPHYGQEEGDGLQFLAEYMLKHLDHNDRKAVECAYRFYDRVCADNVSLSVLAEELQEILAEEKAEPARQNVREKAGVLAAETVSVPEMEWEFPLPQTQEAIPKASFTHRLLKSGQFTGFRKVLKVLAGVLIVIVPPCAGLYLGWLDSTQAGGLTFLIIAAGWLILSTVQGKKAKEKNVWGRELKNKEDDDEEKFMEALLADMYAEDKETVTEQPENLFSKEFAGGMRGAFSTERSSESQKPEAETGDGQTRYLTQTEGTESLCLISLNPRRSADLLLRSSRAIIGKKAEQVDLCIPSDTISRIHASLEQTGDNRYFVTDLNSRNGTFVTAVGANGLMLPEKQLLPNQRFEVHEGDRIRFAALSFRLQVRNL